MLKPFLILTAMVTCGAFLKGIFSLSFFWTLVGMIFVYFLIVVFSLYELLEFEGDQRDCHQSATSQGYSQTHEPDADSKVCGYQNPQEFYEP